MCDSTVADVVGVRKPHTRQKDTFAIKGGLNSERGHSQAARKADQNGTTVAELLIRSTRIFFFLFFCLRHKYVNARRVCTFAPCPPSFGIHEQL